MRNIVLIALFFLVACSDAASHSMQPETQTPKSSASKTPDAVPASSSVGSTSKVEEATVKLKIHVNDTAFTATFEENSSAKVFAEFLAQGDLTLDMHDYGSFEKVADLPRSFPRNDKQIDTDAGDIILYQGNSITIYYDKNSWNFTRLARIDNVNKKRLKEILGKGNVKATFSVE
ncbi:cyclophilin-like fold protein [Fibrobacter sp.]|uniref:cyclophilin-like fold protein n=1 Tax=Fibrobacter sp. TaxID=35828 RepID=UPI00388E77D4